MSAITTHVLDTSKGVPAKGIKVQLLQFNVDTDQWVSIGTSITDTDGNTRNLKKGRCKNLMTGKLTSALYKLVFQLKEYFEIDGVKSFFPGKIVWIHLVVAELCFEIPKDANSHYHIPLLLSPFSYTTYRGS